MNKKPNIPTYKGRIIGVVILTVAQLFVGTIHVLFGFLLLSFGASLLQATLAYNIYTIVFGLLACVFAVFIWQGRKAGWVGTIAVSLFVVVADILAIFNLPSISGIPKFAAPTEIGYCIIILSYLALKHVRKIFLN